MAWDVELTPTALKQLKKIDRKWQSEILDYLEDEIAVLDDPGSRGKPLSHDKNGLWRYRVGDYRIICQILDEEYVLVAVTIGHRKKVFELKTQQ